MVSSARQRREKRKVTSARQKATKRAMQSALTSLALPPGAQMFSVKKEGVYRIDLIPFVVGEGNPFFEEGALHYERTYYTHPRIGAGSDTYVCLAETYGLPCPICEHRAQLEQEDNPDEELIKTLRPKERQLFNVWDLSEPEKGIQIWEFSFHNFGKLLDEKINKCDPDDEEKYDRFHDPENGMSLRLGVTEQSGGGYTYYEVTDIELKERKEQYDPSVVDDAYCLDEIIKVTPYEELHDIYWQSGDASDVSGDDEDSPATSKGKTTMAKKATRKKVKAADVGIVLGSSVEHATHGVCDVVHISPDGTSLRLQDENDEVHKAISCADVTVLASLASLGAAADEGDEEAVASLTAKASDAGLDPDDYGTWAELAEALPEPEPTSPGAAADEGDEEAVASLEAAAEEAGIDPNDYGTWVELEEALPAADGGAQEAEELGAAADDGNEEAIDTLTAAAEQSGLDPNDYATWTDLETALGEANEGGDEDLATLGEAADGEDEDAVNRLTELAGEHSLDPNDYGTWAELAEALSGDGDGEDLLAMGSAADEEDESAQAKLEELAAEAGVDPDQYGTWGELAEAISEGGGGDDGGEDLEGVGAAADEGDADSVADLEARCEEAGIDPNEYGTWAEVANVLSEGGGDEWDDWEE